MGLQFQQIWTGRVFVLKLRFSAAVIATLFAGIVPAFAQTYPTRPVTLIVPAPPGGGTDVFARQLAEIIEPVFKQKIVIENKAGAGGTLGVTQLTTAKPDGYTLAFIWNSPLTTSPQSLNVSYTPEKYRPLMSIGFSSYVLCAQPSFVGTSAKDFVAALKAPNSRFTYGNDGVGGTMQFAAERIFSKVGVKVKGIPFAGAGETAKNFLGGHVDFYGGSLPPILAHVQAGKAKCLLLTSAAGNPALPGVDGLDSLGLGAEETVLWWGLIAPAGLPAELASAIEKAFVEAASGDKFKEVMERQGATRRILGAAQTTDLINKELVALTDVAKSLGIEKKNQ
jgi:tripartite-type tricarboxylate transporter receptor subunit TctC